MTTTKKNRIGKNIKKHRKKQKISQDTLSKKANLAFHTIAKIEAGPLLIRQFSQWKKLRMY